MFKELKKRVDKFKDTVYYEPMSETEIVDFERKIGNRLNSVYREFLLTFGLVQDINKDLSSSEESILEDVVFFKDSLPDFFPIFVELDVVDTIYLMSISHPETETIYKIEDKNGELGKVKPYKTLTELLSDSILEIEKEDGERCPNSDKINCFEYCFESKYYNDFIVIFKNAGLEQLSDWKPKYFTNNVFGDEIAEFSFCGTNIQIQKSGDAAEYIIEFEEPILTTKVDSIASKLDNMFNSNKISYIKEVLYLIGY